MREARKRFPDDPDLVYLDAYAHCLKGDEAGGLRILEAGPCADEPYVWTLLASCRIAVGKGDSAGPLLEKALSRDPKDHFARIHLMRLAIAGGDCSKAEALVREAGEIDIRAADYLEVRQAYEEGIGDLDKAVETAWQVTALDSDSDRPWRALVFLLHRTGRRAEMLHALEEANHRFPLAADYVRPLVWEYLKRGKLAAAFGVFSKWWRLSKGAFGR